MTLQHTQVNHGFPEADVPRNRVCLFENVCWSDGGIVFYADRALYNSTPAYLWPDSFGPEMVDLGYLGTPWTPSLRFGPTPRRARRARHHTYLLHASSLSDNFGHALMDDLVPAIAAMHIFNLSLTDGQLLTMVGCSDARTFAPASPHESSPYHPHLTRSELCADNMSRYASLMLGRPPLDPHRAWGHDTVCMDRMIAGHSSALSLRALNLARAPALRLARDAMVDAAGLATKDYASSVLVLQKGVGFNGGALWPTACRDVSRAVGRVNATVPVRCSDPAAQDAQAQIRDVQASTVVVAEHGTLSYGALFGRDGTILISVGSSSVLKEVQVNLFATHYETYYFPIEDVRNQLEGIMRFALSMSVRTTYV